MTDRLAGKTAFITAAGQGIGRAVAEAYVREGARVIATDINEELLADLARTMKCETRRLDVTDASAVLAATIEAGTRSTVDVLFNGAGYVHAGTILETDEVAFDFSFDLNVRAMYRMIRALLPPMVKLGHGSIINVASAASSIKGVPNRFAYGTTKAAVIGHDQGDRGGLMSRSGVRCNAICPGHDRLPVAAPAGRAEQAVASGHPARRMSTAAFVARQPVGRLGTARGDRRTWPSISPRSDESAFTTGTNAR